MASLNAQHVEPGRRWAAAAEDYFHLRTENKCYNFHRLAKIGQQQSEPFIFLSFYIQLLTPHHHHLANWISDKHTKWLLLQSTKALSSSFLHPPCWPWPCYSCESAHMLYILYTQRGKVAAKSAFFPTLKCKTMHLLSLLGKGADLRNYK